MAHGTVAATGLQDSWLTSLSHSLSPVLPSSIPQRQDQLEGWPKGCPPPCWHPAWSVQQQSSAAPIWKNAHTQPAVLAACKSNCWPSALAAGMQKCKAKGTKGLLPFSPLYLFIQLVNLVWDAVCSVGSLCHPQATVTLIKSKYFNKERAIALHDGPTLCKQQ